MGWAPQARVWHALCNIIKPAMIQDSRLLYYISPEKLKCGWTWTTSQYTITHILYFKTQRTVVENKKLHNKQTSNVRNLHTHTHTHTCAHTHTCMDTHAHSHPHTHSHTHTHCSDIWTNLSIQKYYWLQNNNKIWLGKGGLDFVNALKFSLVDADLGCCMWACQKCS